MRVYLNDKKKHTSYLPSLSQPPSLTRDWGARRCPHQKQAAVPVHTEEEDSILVKKFYVSRGGKTIVCETRGIAGRIVKGFLMVRVLLTSFRTG